MKTGSGSGSVGRAVTSNTRCPRFKSSHRQKFIYALNICLLSTVYWKDENKEKEAGNGPFLKKKWKLFLCSAYVQLTLIRQGTRCAAVGRAVASYTRMKLIIFQFPKTQKIFSYFACSLIIDSRPWASD